MTDMVRVRVWMRTNKVGSKCDDVAEFTREEWAQMDDDDKENALRDVAFNMGDWGWEEIT